MDILKEMTKEEKLIREYFEPIEDINGNETIEVLPLILIDMLLEYEEIVKNLTIPIVSNNEVALKCDCCNNEIKDERYCYDCYEAAQMNHNW